MLQPFEQPMHRERQRGGGYRSGEQHHVIVQREALRDSFTETSRADESGDGSGAHVDHGRRLDAGEDRGKRQRQFDPGQDVARPETERHRRLAQAHRHAEQAGVRVANDGEQRVEE